jgi:hypothetical protein
VEKVLPAASETIKVQAPVKQVDAWRYPWKTSRKYADLIADGVVGADGKMLVAIDVFQDGSRMIRLAAEASQSLFGVCRVGMRIKDPLGREKKDKFELIRLENVRKGSGLRARHGAIETIAPKIDSLRDALLLDKREVTSLLPPLPWDPDPIRSFAIVDRTGLYEIQPFVVRVEQPRSTEAIIHVYLYAQYGSQESPCWSYLGKAFMSYRAAFRFARYSYLYGKVAMPNGGSVPVDLLAGKSGLKVRLDEFPELVQVWFRRYSTVFELPFSEEILDLRSDWASGFPPEFRAGSKQSVP